MAEVTSPERRSAADLQRILDSLIGDAGFVLSGKLPEVLAKYETAHDLTIIDPAEAHNLRALCEMHSDMELGPEEMFNFLKAVVKTASPAPSSPSPAQGNRSLSQSIPSSSFKELDQTTPRQSDKQRRRRNSDRIRSPSDSSSTSSSDEDATGMPIRKALDRHTSSPPISSSFPSSSSVPSFLNRPSMPKRTKTVSDPRMDSPLAGRSGSRGGPPSAFGGSNSFARPSPASRRRRSGSSTYQSGEEDSSAVDRPIGRSMSSISISNKGPSPPWPTRGLHQSQPTSPTYSEMNMSFQRVVSPEQADVGDKGAVEIIIEGQGDLASVDDGELEETEDTMGHMAEIPGATLNPRLNHISTASSNSLRTSHDKLQELKKQNADLARKLKEAERQLTLLGADNDRMVVDLERQLEDTRSELAQKKKDEKDMRNEDLTQKLQISGLEADYSTSQRQLEQTKERLGNMQKMYDSQCEEAQRLRDILRDRDLEIRNLEEAAQEHENDEDRYKAELHTLEAENRRLESELEVSRKAEAMLETQREENMQLKESLDRMRFDLDEARAAAANQLKVGGVARSETSGSSRPPTLSRNLGDEINRRLMEAAAKASEDGDEVDEDDVVETVVTTRQTRKRGSRAPSGSVGVSGSASLPTIRLEENVVREYADAATLTEPVSVEPVVIETEQPEAGPSSTHEHPPAYTAEPEPANAQEVLERAHRRGPGTGDAAEVEYDAVVMATGVRCSVLEEELEKRRTESAKAGASIRRSSWAEARRTYALASGGIVNHIIYNTSDVTSTQVGIFGVCAAATFAMGLVVGAHLLGASTSGIHPRDYQLFTHMNELARTLGAGEGFLPHGAKGVLSVVGTGAGMLAAGRVPT